MPSLRIRRYRPGEFRLGQLALDSGASFSASLPPVPIEISRLVLEGVKSAVLCSLGKARTRQRNRNTAKIFFNCGLPRRDRTDKAMVRGRRVLCFQIGGGGVNGLTLSHHERVRDTPEFRNLPSHLKCCRTVRHSAAKSLAHYRIYFTFEAIRQLALVRPS